MSKPFLSTAEIVHFEVVWVYLPQAIEVNKFDYPENHQTVLEHIEFVRGVLLEHDIDPDEVDGEINPNSTPNSFY